jgi:hypothetical protein
MRLEDLNMRLEDPSMRLEDPSMRLEDPSKTLETLLGDYLNLERERKTQNKTREHY